MLLVLLLTLFGASATPIGVSPEKAHLYQPTKDNTWSCLSDPSIVLSFDQINDDICDCPDGSDEPGTNACPFDGNQYYWCENKGHFSSYIENFKLNDGVCDYDLCCDGSDELECPNKCEQVHKQYTRHKQLKVSETEKGLKKKRELIKKAQQNREKVEEKLEEIETELAQKQSDATELKKKLPLINVVQQVLNLKSEEADEADVAQLERLEREIKSLESEIAIYKENLVLDFGDDDVYRALVGSWINSNLGEYVYKIGFMDAVYQDNTLIGKFSGFKGNRILYTGGSKCWNGPQRSAEVEAICGAENNLIIVGEPQKCEYYIQITSPVACHELTEEDIRSLFKVDITELTKN